MAKRCVVINSGCTTTSESPSPKKTQSKIRLVCPAESKLPAAGAGYETLAHDLIGFSEIESLPNNIDFEFTG